MPDQSISTDATWKPDRAALHGITFADMLPPSAREALAEVRARLEQDTE